jgi:hypothetical protein
MPVLAGCIVEAGLWTEGWYDSAQILIGRFQMKKEDMWMIIVVVFSIVWTAAFGWGIFG